MDDDIDIEEHDVLDHPQIRDIFPDLSLVKEEVVDLEDEIPEDNVDYLNVEIKEEISDYDTNIEFDSNDDFEPSDTDYSVTNFHNPNKIILGSKPAVKKENLRAYVPLEDYSIHLENNPCYCHVCKRLFSTANSLDAHNMTAHSFLIAVPVNKAKKSTSKNFARKSTTDRKSDGEAKYCDHCNVYFPNQETLIKHLYKLLPAKQFKCSICEQFFPSRDDLLKHTSEHMKSQIVFSNTTLTQVVVPKIAASVYLKAEIGENSLKRKLEYENDEFRPVPKVAKNQKVQTTVVQKFKCTICRVVFGNFEKAKKHRTLQHPNHAFSKVFIKFVTKKKKNTLIPTAIFECKNCKLCFTSFERASLHKVCSKNSDVFKCWICLRKFNNADAIMHTKQHKERPIQTVYPIVKDLIDKVLCCCPYCSVHVSAKYFKVHFKKCGFIPTIKCKKCAITIHKQRSAQHIKLHNGRLFKIEYISHNEVENKTETFGHETGETKNANQSQLTVAKPSDSKQILKSNTQNVSETKIPKSSSKLYYYYCEFCNRCVQKVHPLRHKDCANTTEPCDICLKCGLCFSRKALYTHTRNHEKSEFTLHDISVFSIQTGQQIKPPMPKYIKCLKCRINFRTKLLAKNHVCGEDEVTCNYCKEKFESALFPVHEMFHKYSRDNIIKAEKELALPEGDEIILPELIKKYESLNSIWNIIFQCSKCEVTTDTYDKIVEHSQSHIKNPKVLLKNIKCYICNLKIDETYWPKHSFLHSSMIINAEKFEILVYEPENLLQESWYQMFENLPEEQIRQIVDNSVYTHERSVKMKLIKDGRSEFTIYTCNSCSTAVSQDAIKTHLSETCCAGSSICPICRVRFQKGPHFMQHNRHHVNGVDASEFRIVSLQKVNQTAKPILQKVNETAKPSLQKVNETAKPCLQKVNETAKPCLQTANPEAKYTVYKCIECSTSILKKHNVKRHSCAENFDTIKKCKICKLSFPWQGMNRHKLVHKTFSDFKMENIHIEMFEPTGILPAPSNATAKPTLVVTSKSKKVVTGKIKKKKVDVTKTSENRKAKKYFNNNKFTVFKCSYCSVVVFNKDSCKKHKCTHNKKIECDICKQIYTWRQSAVHKLKHQIEPNFVHTNLKIIPFDSPDLNLEGTLETTMEVKEDESLEIDTSNTAEEIDSPETNTTNSTKEPETPKSKTCTIYKCGCGIHFLTTKSIDKHRKRCGKTSISTEKCSKCHLLFPTDVLVTHLCKHHTRNTTIIVENYIKGEPIIKEETIDDSETDPLNTDLEAPSVSGVNETLEKVKKSTQVKLYKCAICNVHYMNQNTCYKHSLRHEMLNPKQYIECKLCGLQFTIMTLAVHLRKHHETEFSLENVLVEEYKPSLKGPPIIEIYKAIDRVQSLLVSSSNDLQND